MPSGLIIIQHSQKGMRRKDPSDRRRFSDGSLLYQPAGMKEEGFPVTMIAYQPQGSWYLAYIPLKYDFLVGIFSLLVCKMNIGAH